MISIFGQFGGFRKHLEAKWQDLYRMAYAWCQDPHQASDLTQETIARALKSRKQLSNLQSIDAWLYTILANCWKDHCRRKVSTVDMDDIEISHTATPESENERARIIKRVRRAVAMLNQEQRQIITLVDIQGLSYKEVAEILQVPMGTVMSRICRARRNMKRFLHDLRSNETSTSIVRRLR